MATGWTARTGGVDGESGGRLEVRTGERRQTLGFFQLERERLNGEVRNEESFWAEDFLQSSSDAVSQHRLLCQCDIFLFVYEFRGYQPARTHSLDGQVLEKSPNNPQMSPVRTPQQTSYLEVLILIHTKVSNPL